MAIAFGLDVKRFVALAVLAGAVVVAAAVAFGGLVAFVGLAAPHIARWLVGPLHRVAAAGFGAGRRLDRHHRRRDRACGAAALRDSARAGDRGRRRAVLHRAARPQAARMTHDLGRWAGAQARRCDAARGGIACARARQLGCRHRSQRGGQIDAAEDARRHRTRRPQARFASAARTWRASPVRRAREQIGYLPQHFEPHWDLAVADLVRLGAERTGRSGGRGAARTGDRHVRAGALRDAALVDAVGRRARARAARHGARGRSAGSAGGRAGRQPRHQAPHRRGASAGAARGRSAVPRGDARSRSGLPFLRPGSS